MSIEQEEEIFMEELAKRSQLLLENISKKEAMIIQDQIDYAIENRQELIQSVCLSSKKYLDLGSSNIDDFDSITIGIYLNELHYNLEVINLGTNKLSDEGLLNMLIGMQFHSNLKELYLGNNQFTIGTAIEGLATILPCLKNLQILGLGGINIDDEDLVKVCYGLSELNSLKNLQLHKNKISDEGLLCIISMMLLGFGNDIETLYLGQNEDITEEGIIKLFECLQMNQTLKCLHINDIIMTDKSLQAINICLMTNRHIEELSLGNSGIDDEGMKMLTDCLKNNTNLQYLHLWNNYLTYESGNLIQEILENYNSTLKGITLYNNDIINKELLNDIQALTQQNVYFVSTVNNEDFYEKKIQEMKNKYNEELQNKKNERQEILLQGKVKGIKNNSYTQNNVNIVNKSQLSSASSTTLSQKSQLPVSASKLPSSISSVQSSKPASTFNSNLATKRPQSGVVSQKLPPKQQQSNTTTVRAGTAKQLATPSFTSSKTATSTISKAKPNISQTPVKPSIKGSSSALKTNSTTNKNNSKISNSQLSKQKNEDSDEDDLEYVPLSQNFNDSTIKRQICTEEDIYSNQDNILEYQIKSRNYSKQVASDMNKQKQNINEKLDSKLNSKIIKAEKEEEEDDNVDNDDDIDFQEEWLDDDEEDEKQLQMLEKQLEQDEEIISKERNATRLEYVDEFYDEEESTKHIKKYSHFDQNLLSYDLNDPNTLKWQGFFEDKKTGLLKSKLQ